MRTLFLIAAAALGLAGCAMPQQAAPLDPGIRFSTALGYGGDFSFAMNSFEERRFDTVVRQRYDFSCGSAALATLLRFHYGNPHDEAATFRGMWAKGDRDQIRRLGFSLLDMKRYLQTIGFEADGYQVTLEEVEKAGVPGIVLINLNGYKHFVVVKGVDETEVLVGDPALGLKVMPRAEFQKVWSGIYFALNEEPGRFAKTFDTDAQWARFARGPARGIFLEPVSQAALTLTAPFYREF